MRSKPSISGHVVDYMQGMQSMATVARKAPFHPALAPKTKAARRRPGGFGWQLAA